MPATRRATLPISGWKAVTGSFVVSGQNNLYQMDDTVQSYLVNNLKMPKDWNGGNFSVVMRIMDGTVSGNAFMTLLMDVWKTGEASTNIVNATTAVAMLNTNNTQRQGSFTVTGSNVESDDVVAIRVGRLGDNASDTCNGTALYMVEVFIEYTTRSVTFTFSANTKIKSAEANTNNVDLQ